MVINCYQDKNKVKSIINHKTIWGNTFRNNEEPVMVFKHDF